MTIALAGADVDASNLELVLGPTKREEHDFVGGEVTVIDPNRCITCDTCQTVCRFDTLLSPTETFTDAYKMDSLSPSTRIQAHSGSVFGLPTAWSFCYPGSASQPNWAICCEVGNILHIENVDVIDGTPVLDIKPYVPEFDHHPADRVGWLEQARDKVQSKKSDDRFG